MTTLLGLVMLDSMLDGCLVIDSTVQVKSSILHSITTSVERAYIHCIHSHGRIGLGSFRVDLPASQCHCYLTPSYS